MDSAERKRLDAAESLLAKLGVPVRDDKKDEGALDKAIEQALEGAQNPADKADKGAEGKSADGKPAGGLQQPANGDPLDGRSRGERKR